MHQKNREDANPAYESLVNLEKYHSKIHHGEVQILTHIKASSGRTAVRSQCCDESCDRQQPAINWRNLWTENLKKQLVWKKTQIRSRLSLDLTSAVLLHLTAKSRPWELAVDPW
jgi:hypothetical protein